MACGSRVRRSRRTGLPPARSCAQVGGALRATARRACTPWCKRSARRRPRLETVSCGLERFFFTPTTAKPATSRKGLPSCGAAATSPLSLKCVTPAASPRMRSMAPAGARPCFRWPPICCSGPRTWMLRAETCHLWHRHGSSSAGAPVANADAADATGALLAGCAKQSF